MIHFLLMFFISISFNLGWLVSWLCHICVLERVSVEAPTSAESTNRLISDDRGKISFLLTSENVGSKQ